MNRLLLLFSSFYFICYIVYVPIYLYSIVHIIVPTYYVDKLNLKMRYVDIIGINYKVCTPQDVKNDTYL